MPQQEYELREKLLAKLTSVRSELQDALRLATMLSEPIRNKLASPRLSSKQRNVPRRSA